eukprot:Tbor_TRINITY_DN5086_c0_g1::TRINITY_DN5086_c0_g1_i1::g.14035::m.14035
MFRVKSSGVSASSSAISEQAFQKLMFNGRSFQRFSSHNSEVLSKYLTSNYPSHAHAVKNRTAQPHNPLNAQVSSHSNPGVNLLVPHQYEQYFVAEDYITNVLKSSLRDTKVTPCVLPLAISTFQGGNNFSVPGGGLEPRKVYHISEVEGYEHYRDVTPMSTSIFMSGGSTGGSSLKDIGCTGATSDNNKPLTAKSSTKSKKSTKKDDNSQIDEGSTTKKGPTQRKKKITNEKLKKTDTNTDDILNKSTVEPEEGPNKVSANDMSNTATPSSMSVSSTASAPSTPTPAIDTISDIPSVSSGDSAVVGGDASSSPSLATSTTAVPCDKSKIINTATSADTTTHSLHTPILNTPGSSSSSSHASNTPPVSDNVDEHNKKKLMHPTEYSSSAFKIKLPRCALSGMFFQREEITDNLLSASRYFGYQEPFWIRTDHPQLHKFLKLGNPNTASETVSLATHTGDSSSGPSEDASGVSSITLGLNSVVFAIEDLHDHIPTALLHRSLHPLPSAANIAGASRRQTSYDLSGNGVRRGMNACTGFVSMGPYFHSFTDASGDNSIFADNANKSGVWLSLDQIHRYQLKLKDGTSPVMLSSQSSGPYSGDVRCSWTGNGQLVEIEEWELYNSAQLAVPGRVSLRRAAIDDNKPPSLFE